MSEQPSAESMVPRLWAAIDEARHRLVALGGDPVLDALQGVPRETDISDPVKRRPVDRGKQPRECDACGHSIPVGGSSDCGLGHEPPYELGDLIDSHGVSNVESLVQVMAQRIDRLIEKLPPTRDEQPRKTRFT